MHGDSRDLLDWAQIGGLLSSPGAEEDLGDPEEADRMQLCLSSFFNERYKYMQ
jgi:hypothetical protein